MLGTLEGAGRSRRLLTATLAAAMMAGALALSAATYGMHALLAPAGRARPLIVVGLLAALLVLEFTGRVSWLSGNRRVPAAWVAGADWKAGLIWGGALGTGLVTEAPFGVLHAALIIAACCPAAWPAVAAPLLFGLARLVMSVTPAVRTQIIGAADSFVRIAGREVSAGFLVARLCSRVALIAAAAIAVAGLAGR